MVAQALRLRLHRAGVGVLPWVRAAIAFVHPF